MDDRVQQGDSFGETAVLLVLVWRLSEGEWTDSLCSGWEELLTMLRAQCIQRFLCMSATSGTGDPIMCWAVFITCCSDLWSMTVKSLYQTVTLGGSSSRRGPLGHLQKWRKKRRWRALLIVLKVFGGIGGPGHVLWSCGSHRTWSWRHVQWGHACLFAPHGSPQWAPQLSCVKEQIVNLELYLLPVGWLIISADETTVLLSANLMMELNSCRGLWLLGKRMRNGVSVCID